MEIKTKNPREYLVDTQDPLIEIIFALNHLKNLYRQGWLKNNVPTHQCESVADHIFGVAILAMIVADEDFPELDCAKVMRMALIHDLGEIYAGDLVPSSGLDLAEKHRIELESLTNIFRCHRNGDMYINLWDEYEKGLSPEAVFVRQIDKLEMAFQASIYSHQFPWGFDQFFESSGDVISNPTLIKILDTLRYIQG